MFLVGTSCSRHNVSAYLHARHPCRRAVPSYLLLPSPPLIHGLQHSCRLHTLSGSCYLRTLNALFGVTPVVIPIAGWRGGIVYLSGYQAWYA